MSERMRQIPFDKLLNWVMMELKEENSIFGIDSSKFYKKKNSKVLEIFGETLETPIGPAAGPNSQLAQNIIASYLTGSRFFEVKTVQTMDGEDLASKISRPCINAQDECYNVEWSTELYVPQALDEYIKGYMLITFLSKELGLGAKRGFAFNMSVGYDYAGITSKKIDDYIEGLKDASKTEYFQYCKKVLLDNVSKFKNVDAEFIETISPKVCDSITLSTLHGCPASEIEKIAHYLLTEKKMHTFIKCNPTLLGYESAREICDRNGYEYISFDDHHFKNDLQFADAVEMFKRLQSQSRTLNLQFGVKLTNTFPVRVENGELPGEEMYMSGRSLYPLSINVADRLAKAFNGDLKVSFSGGADFFNVEKIFDTGIWPITIATTVLKAGGYVRYKQIAETLDNMEFKKFEGIDLTKLEVLANEIDPNHHKSARETIDRKLDKKVPLLNCFIAPCKNGCPINQDIPEYIRLVGEKDYKGALEVITERNAMPFTTGVLCAHPCMTKCTRLDYDESVNIRGEKLLAAEKAYDEIIKDVKAGAAKDVKVAIIGGGPAGLSAGYFLGKNGIKSTIFEMRDRMGGVMGNIVPQFRIADELVDKDIALTEKCGVEFKYNVSPDFDVKELFAQGYKYIFLAIGAYKATLVTLDKQDKAPLNVISFLESFRKSDDLGIGKNVAIVGAGNSAMDAARAAKRVKGVENVYVIYRRTKALAPAEREEIHLAEIEGINFLELTAPISHVGGVLKCEKMELGAKDASGRRSPVATGTFIELPMDTIIGAIGEKVETSVLAKNGIEINKNGIETNIKNVFIGGDAQRGPATVVAALADGMEFADVVIERETGKDLEIKSFEDASKTSKETILAKKAILAHECERGSENSRCLECNHICEICAEVCPNRANISITVDGFDSKQIIHLDPLCNECGNCKTFCPYDSAPYLDKFTYFSHEEDFAESHQEGFLFGNGDKLTIRLKGKIIETTLNGSHADIPGKLYDLIKGFKANYSYMM